MRKAKATTKPNNRWEQQRQSIVNAALTEASASHASSTSKPEPYAHLLTPNSKAKAQAARLESIKRRKKRREYVRRWKEKNGLTCMGITMTNELWEMVKSLAVEKGVSVNVIINDAVLEYITKPKS